MAPLGSDGDLDDGCGAGDRFTTIPIASSVDRSVPHNLRFLMNLVPGPHNDVVTVFLDGVPCHRYELGGLLPVLLRIRWRYGRARPRAESSATC